jgi:hypothetical protein
MVRELAYTRHAQPPRFAFAHLASGLSSSSLAELALDAELVVDAEPIEDAEPLPVIDDAVEVDDGESLAPDAEFVEPLSPGGGVFFLGGNGIALLLRVVSRSSTENVFRH